MRIFIGKREVHVTRCSMSKRVMLCLLCLLCALTNVSDNHVYVRSWLSSSRPFLSELQVRYLPDDIDFHLHTSVCMCMYVVPISGRFHLYTPFRQESAVPPLTAIRLLPASVNVYVFTDFSSQCHFYTLF